MNSKTTALLALLIIIILIIIIAVYYSYNCCEEDCDKGCDTSVVTHCKKNGSTRAYSPEFKTSSSNSCDDLLEDPWEVQKKYAHALGYRV